MSEVQFDANETVGGFTLTKIRRAISSVGVMDDRDDVKVIAESLECSRSQAERVLTALERRGLVTKASKKNQWDKTQLGIDLSWRWRPPRRLEPVVVRDDEAEVGNIIIESVFCSILRCDSDDADVFEDADLEVGVCTAYDGPRFIEISVSTPDYYDHREESATIESSVYISADDAKKFHKALGEAVERAEAETVRRSKVKPKKRRPKSDPADEEKASRKSKGAASLAPAVAPVVQPKPSTPDPRLSLKATLAELRRKR